MSRKLVTRGSVASERHSDLEQQYSSTVEELGNWQKKFRMLESDRKAYSEDVQSTIRKQRSQIEKLKKDNDQLQEQVNMETRSVATLENAQVAQQLSRLADQKEVYERKIQAEQVRQKELDASVKALQQKIHEERVRLGGVNAAKDHTQAVSKQVKILENRLEKAMVKFNESLTANKALREDIDNLRRERVMFDAIYKKMEKELNAKKAQMAHLIEVSNTSYESRDEALARIAEIKEKAERDQREYDHKLQELTQQIATDKRNKDFLQLMQGKTTKPRDDGMDRSGKKKSKGQMEMDKARLQTQVSMERVQSYEEAFDKIKQATSISDPDEFVTQFIKVEDQNFSLFNYVNELNTEIERLEEQIESIKQEIQKYKGEGQTHDQQRKKILTDLEDRLKRTEQKAEYYDKKYQENQHVINQLKTYIEQLFKKIKCNESAMSEMLGNTGITETNMMAYLGVVEQRTNELLQLYRASSAAEGQVIPAMGPPTPVGGAPVHPDNLPSTGDGLTEDFSDEDDERPLTREELRLRSSQRPGTTERQDSAVRKLRRPEGGSRRTH